MLLKVFNTQKDLSLDLTSVKKAMEEILSWEGVRTDELSIYFVTEKKISLLHLKFFDDPSPTDCISFPLDCDENQGYHVLGDVFICPKAAIAYADPYQELTLYLVHGMLHLMGYDDIEKKDRLLMRRAEKSHMKNLSKKGCVIRSRKKRPFRLEIT